MSQVRASWTSEDEDGQSTHCLFLQCFDDYSLTVLTSDFDKAVRFLSLNILITIKTFLFQ